MDIENKYGTFKLQQSLLKLLKDFCDFCDSNNIKYSLAYGSLLGAIRHKGFIPWDDDLDVIVTREEFEKLQVKLKEQTLLIFEYQTPSSLWVGRITEDGLTNELYPPTIDIFILDNSPNHKLVKCIKLFLVYLLQGMIKSKPSLHKGGVLMKMCTICTWFVGLPFSYKKKFRMYDSICKLSNNHNTKYLGCFNAEFLYLNKIFNNDIMKEYLRVPFEDITVFIMQGYDEYLKSHYGNYMEPPKNKQGHHIYKNTEK